MAFSADAMSNEQYNNHYWVEIHYRCYCISLSKLIFIGSIKMKILVLVKKCGTVLVR